MKAITYYTPDGSAFALFDNTNTFYIGKTGFGGEQVQFIGESTPMIDGVVHRGMRTNGRLLSVSIEMQYETAAARVAAERALRSGLNPYRDRDTAGYLRCQDFDDVIRHISCFPFPYPADSAGQIGPFGAERTLVFWAPEPWFFNPTQQSSSVNLGAPSVTFPITFPVTFSPTNIAETISVNNTGDVDTWPTFVITTPLAGPATAAHIHNLTSGKNMEVTVSMEANDTLTIDMDAPTVLFYDSSAGTTTAATISGASSFWPLLRGNNSLLFQLTGGAGATMNLTYYLQYLGV